MPEGIPELIPPDFNIRKNQPAPLEAVKSNISKIEPFLKPEQRVWWEEFLDEPEKNLHPDAWYLNVLPKCRDHVVEMQSGDTIASPLATVMEAERCTPHVSRGIQLQNIKTLDLFHNYKSC